MKYKSLKMLLSLVVLTVMLFSTAPAVFADATLRIETSASTIAVGKTLTLSVKVSSGVPDLSSVGFDLKFDPAAFTFVSGSINGTAEDSAAKFDLKTNIVQVLAYSYRINSDSDPLIATFKFTAKAASSGAAFSLSDIALGDYSNDVNPIPASFAGAKTVSVFQPSTNADLKTLSVAPGTLSPAFTSANTVYNIQITESVTNLSVDATPADDKAKVSVSGHTGLKTGENIVKVVVTAESGATKTYTINAYKAVPTPTPAATPTPALVVQVNGSSFSVAPLDAGQTPPSGFEATTAMLLGQTVPVFTNAKTVMTLIYLKDGASNGAFYVFDATANTYTLYQTLTIPARNYVVLKPDASLKVPAGFAPVTLTVDGMALSGFQESTPGTDGVIQTLVYLMDASGMKNLYAYDSSTGELLLFSGLAPVPTTVTTPVPTSAVTLTPTPAVANPAVGSLSNYLLIILALSFLVAVLIGILVYLLVSRKAYARSQKPPAIRRVR